jgi:hypothetical protein
MTEIIQKGNCFASRLLGMNQAELPKAGQFLETATTSGEG